MSEAICAHNESDDAAFKANLAELSRAAGGVAVVLDQIDSTSEYLRTHWPMQAAGGATWSVCVAKAQTAGRGRQGHAWHSAAGAGLWFSLAIPVAVSESTSPELSPVPPLSLVLAVRLIQCLQREGFAVMLKWPNDLWLNEQKVGGLLVEQLGRASARYWLVGVGINWYAPRAVMADKIGGAASAVGLLEGQDLSACERARLAVALIEVTINCLQSPRTWAAAMAEINPLHALAGRRIQVWQGEELLVQGCAQEILPNGTLMLMTNTGELRPIGGTLSVRLSG